MERWLELRWTEVRRIGRVVLVGEDRARMRSHRMRDTGSQDYALPCNLGISTATG
jgi:hypothetical protein